MWAKTESCTSKIHNKAGLTTTTVAGFPVPHPIILTLTSSQLSSVGLRSQEMVQISKQFPMRQIPQMLLTSALGSSPGMDTTARIRI